MPLFVGLYIGGLTWTYAQGRTCWYNQWFRTWTEQNSNPKSKWCKERSSGKPQVSINMIWASINATLEVLSSALYSVTQRKRPL